MKHFVIVALILILVSILYQFNKTENFESYNKENSEETLVYNGSTYELWRHGKIDYMFPTYQEYVDFYNFASKKNPNLKPLKPLLKSRWTPGGSMIDTRFVDNRYFNIEHFINPDDPKIKNNKTISQIFETLDTYLKKYDSCDKMKLQDALLNYIAIEYYKLNNKMLSAPSVVDMTNEEQIFFNDKVKNLGDCNTIINTYSKYDFRGKSDTDLKKYMELAIKETSSISSAKTTINNTSAPINNKVESADDKKKKDLLIRDSQQIILQYLDKNPVCKTKLASKDEKFYTLFQTSFSNFMKSEFQKRIGYVPDKSSIESMKLDEANAFIDIYRNLPDCDNLINQYSTSPSVQTKQKDTSETISKKPNRINDVAYVNDDSVMSYMQDIGNSLQDIAFKLDQHILDTLEDRKRPAIQSVSQIEKETTKYVAEESKLRDKIEGDRSVSSGNKVPSVPIKDITAKDSKNDAVEASKKEKKKLLNEAPEFIKNNKNINDNFAYKPEYNNCQLQPSKEIFGAYGWSYMPPQSWSVPQKRPPVCIPTQGQQSTVTAIYDKSVPTDVLDWTQVGSILPKFEYKEEYNPDYYHPGWIAGQEEIQYPFNPKHFKSEVYAMNIAQPTMAKMTPQ